jgi:hypothetical protein
MSSQMRGGMKLCGRQRWLGGLGVALLLVWPGTGTAQTFSSGSTGALGAFTPTSNTTVALPPDGVLNYTTVNIPAGVTITFQRNVANTAVTLLATGDVTIAGTLSVNGASGLNNSQAIAALGGPGGFPGGISSSPSTGGSGPGGGAPSGFGNINATYGAPASFVSLVPLFGGSGGGGGLAVPLSQAGGGGGGGAIVIASSTRITVPSTGRITADGGSGAGGFGGTAFNAGAGSGGAIRLVAPEVSGTGTLEAIGGIGGPTSVRAGDGRIRLESTSGSFTGPRTPAASVSTTLEPVTSTSTPSTANLPSLTITSVNSVAAPPVLTGSYGAADLSLPQGTTNPVSVTVTAQNLPFPTPFTIQVIPQLSGPSSVTGTLTGPVATVQVTLPLGEVTRLLALASFMAPTQAASLFPLIEGEPVDQVLVAAWQGEPSVVTFITRSGKAVPAAEVMPRAWEAAGLHTSRSRP